MMPINSKWVLDCETRGFSLLFNEMGIEKPQIKTPKYALYEHDQGVDDYPSKLFCFYVNDTKISGL